MAEAWLAAAGIALGEVAVALDLGNRIFGGYVRTPARFLARLAVVVGAALLLAAPLPALALWANAAWARHAALAAGIVGLALFLHCLFPYRWGIRRVRLAKDAQSTEPLPPDRLLRRITLELPGLPTRADGLRLLVVSDAHCNSERALARLRRSCAALAGENADCALILGDFGERAELLPEVVETLAGLPGRLGAFCVRGNHDLEAGRGEVLREELARHSVTLLDNRARRLEGTGVTLLGLEWPWRREPLPEFSDEQFILALTHTPDNVGLLARLGVDLAFAGHTHGGCLRVPGLGALSVPTGHGRFLDRGMFRRGGALLYVTVGLGYCPGRPGEAVLATLRRGA